MAMRRGRTNEAQFGRILQALQQLPAEKVTEVLDFVQYLQKRYAGGRPLDESDSWSEQDIHDLTIASLMYAEASVIADDNVDE